MSTPTTPQQPIRDLGYANGWNEDPEIVRKCREMGHRRIHENVRNCVNRYTCETCGFTYLVDSGD